MVANHPGMTDQTSSNIARDGAAKHPQKSFPVKTGMKDQTKACAGVSPGNPGVGPDAAPANPLSKPSPAKGYGPARTAWGMKDQTPSNGPAVLREATNLGR